MNKDVALVLSSPDEPKSGSVFNREVCADIAICVDYIHGVAVPARIVFPSVLSTVITCQRGVFRT